MARDGVGNPGVKASSARLADMPASVWRKSSHSNHDGACVELAEPSSEMVAFRDSKAPDGPALVLPRGEAAAFIAAVVRGEL